MRPIDADTLQDKIEEWLDTVGEVVIGKGLSYYGELLGCIEECPTIDAEPVRHGKWIQIWENPDDSNNVLCSCSVCGQNNNWYKNILHSYCPNCGAKMDGEKEMR